MLFKSPAYTAAGGPSLYTLTKNLAGDPEGAPSALWTDQATKNAVNVAYSLIRNKMRALDVGYTKKVAYETSVADQKNYSLPTDFISRLTVEMSTSGANLSTATPSTSNSIFLEPLSTEQGLEIYNSGSIGNARIVVQVGAEYWILGPPSSSEAGTNSIRLTYEAETSQLSGDTDEPLLPVPLRPLICYEAAIMLRTGLDIPVNDLDALARPLRAQIDMTLAESLNMRSHQIPVSGLRRPRHGRQTKMGQIRR